MPTKKRPTQSDVARVAGVSRATVSFVLNGTSGSGAIPISDETRTRVLEAARQLNYAPDPVAQMLASGSNRIIGVFTYEEAFPLERSDFYYDFILGIERAAARFDYNVILFTRHGAEHQPRRVYATNTNSLRLADGTLFLGADPDRAELARLTGEEYAFVFIGRREVPGCEIDWVAADYLPGARQAAEHLILNGHRRLAFVGSGAHIEANQDKISGIHQAIAGAAGASLEILPEPTLAGPETLARALQESGATAILCSHSAAYDRALELLQQAGRSVPEDYSILSLGDANPNRCFPISPTYISIDRLRWGELAAELLIQKVNGAFDAPQQVRLPIKLVIGTSTRALA